MIPLTLEEVFARYKREILNNNAHNWNYFNNVMYRMLHQRHVGTVEGISGECIGRILAKLTSVNTRYGVNVAIRSFQRWITKTYGLPQYMPPPLPNPSGKPKPWFGRLSEMRAQVNRTAKHMQMPHQKVVMLCGWLYGMKQQRVTRATLQDLLDLPMRGDFYKYLTQARLASFGPALRAWMRPPTAPWTWRKWCAEDPLSWRTLVRAGQAERIVAGIKPTVPRSDAVQILYILPALDQANIEMLPTLWN